jgi:Na+-transporting NADH:ubiquinone oxidoreductase subunit NqrC
MNQPPITVIVNGNTYNLSPINVESLGTISSEDRKQLIALLEAVKQQATVTQAYMRQEVESAVTTTESIGYSTDSTSEFDSVNSDRLRQGDIESRVAQLMMEERNKQKPTLTLHSLYKWIGGVTVVIILLVLML